MTLASVIFYEVIWNQAEYMEEEIDSNDNDFWNFETFETVKKRNS